PGDTPARPTLPGTEKTAARGPPPPKGVSSTDYRDSAEHGSKALERLLAKDAEPILPLMDKTVRRTPESGKYVLGALAHVKKLPAGAVDLALAHTHSEDEDTRAAAIALAGKATSA